MTAEQFKAMVLEAIRSGKASDALCQHAMDGVLLSYAAGEMDPDVYDELMAMEREASK